MNNSIPKVFAVCIGYLDTILTLLGLVLTTLGTTGFRMGKVVESVEKSAELPPDHILLTLIGLSLAFFGACGTAVRTKLRAKKMNSMIAGGEGKNDYPVVSFIKADGQGSTRVQITNESIYPLYNVTLRIFNYEKFMGFIESRGGVKGIPLEKFKRACMEFDVGEISGRQGKIIAGEFHGGNLGKLVIVKVRARNGVYTQKMRLKDQRNAQEREASRGSHYRIEKDGIVLSRSLGEGEHDWSFEIPEGFKLF